MPRANVDPGIARAGSTSRPRVRASVCAASHRADSTTREHGRSRSQRSERRSAGCARRVRRRRAARPRRSLQDQQDRARSRSLTGHLAQAGFERRRKAMRGPPANAGASPIRSAATSAAIPAKASVRRIAYHRGVGAVLQEERSQHGATPLRGVPARASAQRRVSVATPERWQSRLSADARR